MSASGSVGADYTPVATYNNYLQAQKAVDYLSDKHFPVQQTAIVGIGLKLMEKVLGRLTSLRAIGMGALSGAWIGVLIGLFLAIFLPRFGAALAVILWGLIWGAIAGAIFGLISYLFTRGQRDFIATSQLVADRYEVRVDPAQADSARDLLREGGL
ncbi:general stress protein [Sinosporangium album]|nr:general stress protein [Sinosporangium album]